MTGPERREQITADIVARTGITEAMIERLVRNFYDRVRNDEMLGPIFGARISDWEPHLAQMCAFWSSVALMSGRYHGAPMPKHLPLPVDAAHFDRWLALFEATAKEVCHPRQKRISSSARDGSRRASNSGLPVRTASCSPSANGSGAGRRQSRHVAALLLS